MKSGVMNDIESPVQMHRCARVNAFLDRVQASNVPGRLFLFFLTGSRALTTYAPTTTFGKIFVEAQPVGIFVAVVALVGLIDTLVNDVLPDKYRIDFALSVRHVALMICAAFFALATYLAVDVGFSWVILPECVACALTIATHTFLDLRRRFKWGR